MWKAPFYNLETSSSYLVEIFIKINISPTSSIHLSQEFQECIQGVVRAVRDELWQRLLGWRGAVEEEELVPPFPHRPLVCVFQWNEYFEVTATYMIIVTASDTGGPGRAHKQDEEEKEGRCHP